MKDEKDQRIEELESELEVMRLRLEDGITVMNARQAEYRAEIARLTALLEAKK